MDPQPSTSGLSISPPRKRATLGCGHLSVQEKQSVLNMYKELIRNDPTIKKTLINQQISTTLGNIHKISTHKYLCIYI